MSGVCSAMIRLESAPMIAISSSSRSPKARWIMYLGMAAPRSAAPCERYRWTRTAISLVDHSQEQLRRARARCLRRGPCGRVEREAQALGVTTGVAQHEQLVPPVDPAVEQR